MKHIFTISFLLLVFSALARENKSEMSKPLDISLKGWNRVLYMNNGTTLLFHSEPSHMIQVKVFDSARNEKLGREDNYRVLDHFGFNEPVIKGVYEINGEAVLFIDQQINSRHCLVRLRYDASNGRLIEEKKIAESRSANKRMEFYVIKHKDEENYAVLFSTDISYPRSSDIYMVYFDKTHTALKEVQLEVNRKKFDYLKVLGAEAQPNGILVSLGLDKTRVWASPHDAPITEGSGVYDHFVRFFYIPKDSAKPLTTMINVSETVYPSFGLYTYNSFARTINYLLYNSHAIAYEFGLDGFHGVITSTLFLKMDEEKLAGSLRQLKNNLANNHLKSETDTSKYFAGIPAKMVTNENGLTTIISEAYISHKDQSTASRYDTSYTTLRIGITQTDDDGRELWGTVLPCGQYYSLMPRESYSYHFNSFRTYSRGKDFFILFNDYDHNFNNSLKEPGYTINNYENTNAFYYKLNSKKEVTKNYVFGLPAKNEFKCTFIDADYFNEHTGGYAALIQYKKGETVTVRMAWSRLE